MDGAVPREIVVAVLQGSGVSVSQSTDAQQRLRVTMIRDTVVEVQFLPDMVPRRLVLRLSHKFEVPAHYFWHPDMMPKGQQLPGLLPS